MNILDENISEGQRAALRMKRVAVRKIGDEIVRKGIKDDQIIPLLHHLDRPTFFRLDRDFCDFRLCHKAYCLVHLAVQNHVAAEYIRRVLRHPELNTKGKRMGAVIRVLTTKLVVWRKNHRQEEHLSWT